MYQLCHLSETQGIHLYMGTIVSALQDLWALIEIMYVEGLAQSLLQSTAHSINTIIIIMLLILLIISTWNN